MSVRIIFLSRIKYKCFFSPSFGLIKNSFTRYQDERDNNFDDSGKFHLIVIYLSVYSFTEVKTCRSCICAAPRILGKSVLRVLRTASVAIKVKAEAKENQVETPEARIHAALQYHP